jgi:hypothetical protein
LALRPSGNTLIDGVDDTSDLVSRHTRILYPRPQSFLGHGIAVADAASLNFDAHESSAGLRDFAFNDFKGPSRPSNLHDTHL